MDRRRRICLLNYYYYYYYYHYHRLEIILLLLLLLLGKVKERHAVSAGIAGSTAAVDAIRFSACYIMFILPAHTFCTVYINMYLHHVQEPMKTVNFIGVALKKYRQKYITKSTCIY